MQKAVIRNFDLRVMHLEALKQRHYGKSLGSTRWQSDRNIRRSEAQQRWGVRKQRRERLEATGSCGSAGSILGWEDGL